MQLGEQSIPRYAAQNYWGFLRQYYVPALVFSVLLSLFVFAGVYKKSSNYSATSMLILDKKGVQSEFDLLVDDVRNADFEEQILSRSVLEQVIEQFNTKRTKPKPNESLFDIIKDFRKKITIDRPNQSSTLKITVKDKNPALAADYANAIAFAFVNYSKEKAQNKVSDLIRGLDAQIKENESKLKETTDEKNEFLVSRGWDNYTADLQKSSQNVTELKNTLQSLQVYWDTLDNKKTSKAQQMPGQGKLYQAGSELSLMDVARQYVGANNEYDRYASVARQEHEGVLEARLEKDMLEAVLKDKLSNPEKRKKILQKQVDIEQGKLHALLKEEPRMQIIQAQIEYCQQRNLQLLDAKSKAQLILTQWQHQGEDRFDGLQIVDRALPEPKKSPVMLMIKALLVAGFLGLLGFFMIPVIFSLWNAELSQLLGRTEINTKSETEIEALSISGARNGHR